MGTGQPFVLLETAATLFMAGVLWTMQLLNYPLLALVGTEAFPRYEAAHNRRFALVVVPGVLAAACGGIGLAASRPGRVPLWAPICELALLAVVIISTAVLQGRQHGVLARGFDQRTIGPARPLQLDTSGRLVGSGRYRPVEVPSGVHAVSGHAAMPHPGGGATRGSRSARYRDRPGGRCQHPMKGLAR